MVGERHRRFDECDLQLHGHCESNAHGTIRSSSGDTVLDYHDRHPKREFWDVDRRRSLSSRRDRHDLRDPVGRKSFVSWAATYAPTVPISYNPTYTFTIPLTGPDVTSFAANFGAPTIRIHGDRGRGGSGGCRNSERWWRPIL